MWPLVEITIKPRTKEDGEKMAAALARLAAADPSFGFVIDKASGRTLIKGASETHLASKRDLLARTYKVHVEFGAPQVAYRETITRQTEVDYVHKKQSGGFGQYARVKLVLAPAESGKGISFESKVIGDGVPKVYIPFAEKGVMSAMDAGPRAGFPMIDVHVTLIGGAYHEIDSSALAFEFAARGAMREGLQKASPVILEPAMKVEVVTPLECAGAIISDLNARRGRIQGRDTHGSEAVINAMVPLANLFGYKEYLASLTQGRATFGMTFRQYG